MKIAILVLVVLFIVLDLIIYFLHKIKKEEIIEKEKEKECQPPVPLSQEERLEQENTEYTFGHNVHHHYVDGDE